MKKNRRLKTANDFPIMGYRVKPEIKDELSKLMSNLHQLYNRKIGKGEREFKKNELFASALRIGVAEMKRRKP